MSKTKNFSIYLAYGSNLDLQQMSHRCPDATPHWNRLYFRLSAHVQG